jgi:predicted MFS family arabinose efflux permease
VLVLRLVEETEGVGLQRGADLLGALLLTAGLMLGVYGILGVESHGWGSTQTLALGAVSLALLGAFVIRQALIDNPLMPLRLFRSRNVAGANLVQVMLLPGLFGLFFLGALYLQRVLGYDALQVGFAYLPMALVMGTMSFRFTAELNARFGPRATVVAAMISIIIALALFARTPTNADYLVDILPSMIFFGLGAGLGFPSLMTLAMSGATESESGLAGGLVNTSMQVGGAVGLAVLATIATQHTHSLQAGGQAGRTALNGGYHLAYVVAAGLVLVAIGLALTLLQPEQRGEPLSDGQYAGAHTVAEPTPSEAG